MRCRFQRHWNQQHTRARFTFEDMLSNRYRLDQINDALEAMRAFREVKPVVVP